MLLATLLLLCSLPQKEHTAKVASATNPDRSSVSTLSSDRATETTSKDSPPAAELPTAPVPKVTKEAQPLKPALGDAHESPRQRKMWYALTMVGSGGAAFDAWSTRRAVSGGYGQEANPFLRPFANSNLLYAATQVSPALMDFLGKRLMTNEHRWARKVWWLPQTAGASFSFIAGAHNVRVVH